MAISRHSDEWKRTIATAALLGVTFMRSYATRTSSPHAIWYAKHPALPGPYHQLERFSKIEAARDALAILGAKISDLPDAAKKRAPRSGANELRSST